MEILTLAYSTLKMVTEGLIGGRVDLNFGIDVEKQAYIMSKNQGKIYKIINML
jgi:hypothetical protein